MRICACSYGEGSTQTLPQDLCIFNVLSNKYAASAHFLVSCSLPPSFTVSLLSSLPRSLTHSLPYSHTPTRLPLPTLKTENNIWQQHQPQSNTDKHSIVIMSKTTMVGTRTAMMIITPPSHESVLQPMMMIPCLYSLYIRA